MLRWEFSNLGFSDCSPMLHCIVTHNEWQVIMISISSEFLATWHIFSEHFYLPHYVILRGLALH